MPITFLKSFVFRSIIAALFATALFAYGAWSEPTGTPPGGSAAGALNSGNIFQKKQGALILNAGSGFDSGLVVFGNSDANGRVGLGTASPTDKLDIRGGLNLSGIIIPYLDYAGGLIDKGIKDQLLAFSQYIPAPGNYNMDWTNDLAWLTIQRLDITQGTSCTSVLPLCPAGWQQEEVIDFSSTCQVDVTKPMVFGKGARICSKEK